MDSLWRCFSRWISSYSSMLRPFTSPGRESGSSKEAELRCGRRRYALARTSSYTHSAGTYPCLRPCRSRIQVMSSAYPSRPVPRARRPTAYGSQHAQQVTIFANLLLTEKATHKTGRYSTWTPLSKRLYRLRCSMWLSGKGAISQRRNHSLDGVRWLFASVGAMNQSMWRSGARTVACLG